MVGSDVAVGETVVTGEAGKVELIFGDGTRLVVGPRSALLIEDYLLRRDGSPGTFAIDALQGSFRFITGKSPKDSYRIRTATGTIGIRGTKFDFVVDPSKDQTHIALFEGELTVCNLAGACVVLANRCDIATFGAEGASLLEGDKRSEWQAKFPFANVQSGVDSRFRIAGAGACMRGPARGSPGSLIAPGERGGGDGQPGSKPTSSRAN